VSTSPRRSGGTVDRARPALVLVVVAAVALGGVIDAVVGHALPARAEAVGTAVVGAPEAGASASFCAGGTAGAGQPADPVVYLTNTGAKPVRGAMRTVAARHAAASGSHATMLTVPARSTVAVDPTPGVPTGPVAASFVFDGGGVVASQLVRGPGGWAAAPCATRPAQSLVFAGGSTAGGSALTLSLLDPTAAPAVVDVTFLTPSGAVVPAPYQGIDLAPGQLVSEDVGTYVQNAGAVATLVTTESGSVVADELEQWSGGAGLSLWLGARGARASWSFADTTATAGGGLTVTVANPGEAATTATVSFELGQASVVPRRVVVPGRALATVDLTSSGGLPVSTPFGVVVTARAPVVVARTVTAPSAAAPPRTGAWPGVGAPARQWLVPGPAPVGPGPLAGVAPSDLAVADPGRAPVDVTVVSLATGRTVDRLVVAGDGVGVVAGGKLTAAGPVVVRASAPVAVEAQAVPAGAPGVVVVTAVPYQEPRPA
jgi:hypothetical protein